MTKTDFDEYNNHLVEMIKDLAEMKARGEKITAEMVVSGLMYDRDNSAIREWVLDNTDVSKGDFNSALHRARVREDLGSVPGDACQLVAAYVAKHGVECEYSGVLRRKVLPTMEVMPGEVAIITPEDRANSPMVDLYADMMFRPVLTLADMEREIRLIADRLHLRISREAIGDAVVDWYEKAKTKRLFDLYIWVQGTLDERPLAASVEETWMNLGGKVFDTSETSPEFVAAVIRKFFWQVKRKIRGKPVTDHLMPVFLGPQGVGKSTMVRQMFEPLAELALDVDFKMIADDRNVEIWSSYILFVDEMGFASKADVDTIKNVITAKNLTRRPMRSNAKITVPQNATFIGCSNKELSQLIRDPTGLRRFVGLRFLPRPDWEWMNAIDWRNMWISVDEDSPDPMAPFKSELTDRQEESREGSRVEEWLKEADFKKLQGDRVLARDLYLKFREYEDDFFPGAVKTAKTEWDNEMNRLLKNHPERVPLVKSRGKQGVVYLLKG